MSCLSRLFLAFALLLSVTAAPNASWAEDGHSNHITARLIAESTTIPNDGAVKVALDYTSQPGWHTYWINPGDTGLAPKITWTLPDGVTASDVQWPTPEPLPTIGLMSYGYKGHTDLLLSLSNRSHLAAGVEVPVKAHVDFLVCADICVPESLDVSLTLKVGPTQPGPDAAAIAAATKALPQTVPITATIAIDKGEAALGFSAPADSGLLSQPQGAYFFPAQSDMLNAPAPQALDMGAQGFSLHVKAVGDALPDGTLSGVLTFNDGRAYSVTLNRAPLAAGVHGLGAVPSAETSNHGLLGLLIAVGSAFVGGLILNLMPCVFPVLAMKLFALSRAGHDQSLARRESLVYGIGAILSFVALALILVAAHALGQSLGWGFQLQSPYVTAGLALVMLLVALNMGGFFEIGGWLQQVAGNVHIGPDRPLFSAFMTGVLAVVVAAPCTAPFMAPAIGFALTQGPVVSFAVFVSLGLGFALPFVALTWLITLVPAVAKLLPKPGDWMISLRRFLSVVMFASALWLVSVFAQQVDSDGLVFILFAIAIVVLGTLNKLKMQKNSRPILVAVGIGLFVLAASQPPAKIKPQASDLLPHQVFDIDALAKLRHDNKPVLVDLTAAWCVTCKVNENLVLKTAEFGKALKDTGTVYMVGDWTNQNAAISNYLSLYGRSGVPLYVYYGPNNSAPVVLPQILHTDAVVKLLRNHA